MQKKNDGSVFSLSHVEHERSLIMCSSKFSLEKSGKRENDC